MLLGVADAVISPGDYGGSVTSSLFLAGATVFVGLVVAWCLRVEGSLLPLLNALMVLELVASAAAIGLELATPVDWHGFVGLGVAAVYLLILAAMIVMVFGAGRSRMRRAAAVLLAIVVNIAAAALVNMDGAFWVLSAKIQPLLGREDALSATGVSPPDIAMDSLWEAQPALIEAQRETLRPGAPGRTNVYAMAVAGSGTQALFSREAHEALRATAQHYGNDSRGGVLLSNGAADLLRAPLATRGNLAAAARTIGAVADPKRDLLFLYLTSHGSQNAELTSVLPSYESVQPLTATTTAAALRESGLARRVVVVSACYAGTWIPALADDNTIVITASAKDRTSFGCDDSRRLTVFGEAFLGSLAARDVTLADAFEEAKRKISASEREQNLRPSLPQAYVGRNMRSYWLGEAEPSVLSGGDVASLPASAPGVSTH